MKKLFLIVGSFLLLAGCAGRSVYYEDPEPYKVRHSRIKIAPPDLDVFKVGFQGRNFSEQKTDKANRFIDAYTGFLQEMYPKIKPLAIGSLSASEKKALDDHLALCKTIARAQYLHLNREEWRQKNMPDEWCVGIGLAPLKEKLNADALLLVSGNDYQMNAGMWMGSIAMLVATHGLFSYNASNAWLNVSLLDIESGKIIWSRTSQSGIHSLDSKSGVESMILKSISGLLGPGKPVKQ